MNCFLELFQVRSKVECGAMTFYLTLWASLELHLQRAPLPRGPGARGLRIAGLHLPLLSRGLHSVISLSLISILSAFVVQPNNYLTRVWSSGVTILIEVKARLGQGDGPRDKEYPS